MGTVLTFKVNDAVAPGDVEHLIDGAMEVLHEADLRFSTYRSDSELTLLRSGKADWKSASLAQKVVRELALRWQGTTNGFFDARVDRDDYDPSGIVKTWAAENAASYLQANGLADFSIDAGGDILLSPDIKSPLLARIGIAAPVGIDEEGADVIHVLDFGGTSFRGCATSGTAERGEHIWRQEPESDYVQATVIGPNLLASDIWATALISGGEKAWQLLDSTPEFEALVARANGEVRATPGFLSVKVS